MLFVFNLLYYCKKTPIIQGVTEKESEKMEYENAKNALLILRSPLNRYMHQDSE